MNEILVFGNGWIGSRIGSYLGCPISDKRISSYEDLQMEIDRFKPKAIINCIGHYGKNVDDCEVDKTKSLFSLSFVPILMAEAAIRNGIKLVHLSSAYLFSHDTKIDKPITEETPYNYFNLFYSRTKIYSEAALIAISEVSNILQLRICIPLDYIPHKRNLLDKLIRFTNVIDLPNSITYIPDFLDALKHLIKIDAKGIYNIVNYGGITYRDILEEYRKYYPNHSYAISSLNDLKLIRTNILLSTDKLEEDGFQIRDIHDVIPECVEKYVKIKKGKG